MHFELLLAYIDRYRVRYLKASKSEKSLILDEAEWFTGASRGHLARVLRDRSRVAGGGDRPGRGRPPRYASESFERHLIGVWKLAQRISPARLKAAMPMWLPSYRRHFGPISETDMELLRSVSASTIGRVLKRHRRSGKGLSGTKPNHKLKPQIPIKRLDETVDRPGTIEADTVAHCGDSLAGQFAWTVNTVDVFSGWTETRAVFTKDSKQVCERVDEIEGSLQFMIHTFDTDCGTEFLNYRLMKELMDPNVRKKKRRNVVKMRRSRPYHKDDQAYIEQRNFTHVRNLFGYVRIENPELIELMNEIYRDYWSPLNNFFLPSMKLIEKKRDGAKIKKRFDKPKTPAQRLIHSPHVNEWRKRKLKSELSKLDPVRLTLKLEEKLKAFFQILEESQKRGIAS